MTCPDGLPIKKAYLPLARQLLESKPVSGPLLLGINGAQGTGKSTLAEFLRVTITAMSDWNVAVLSIDDFYFTKSERADLASTVHPLLRIRGVPGTHDVPMLSQCLSDLHALKQGESVALPRFDKASDDRAEETEWPQVEGPIDLIILEGWCVGSRCQTAAELLSPVNALEQDEDADGTWRNYANEQLREKYTPVFNRIDMLVFLKAPSFDAIYRWRLQQEAQLETQMSESEIRHFIQYFERLTRANLAALPGRADIVYELDESHNVAACRGVK